MIDVLQLLDHSCFPIVHGVCLAAMTPSAVSSAVRFDVLDGGRTRARGVSEVCSDSAVPVERVWCAAESIYAYSFNAAGTT